MTTEVDTRSGLRSRLERVEQEKPRDVDAFEDRERRIKGLRDRLLEASLKEGTLT